MHESLKTWREFRGYTLETAAEKIGCSVSQVSRLENGERQLTPKWVAAASKAYGCTEIELLREPETVDDEEHELIGLYRDLPPDKRRLVKDLAKSMVPQPSDKAAS